MKKTLSILILAIVICTSSSAQQYYFPASITSKEDELSDAISSLAQKVIADYKADNARDSLIILFKLQFLAGENSSALETIDTLRSISNDADPGYSNLLFIQHELFVKTRIIQEVEGISFNDPFTQHFNELFSHLDDKSALYISTAFISRTGVEDLKDDYQKDLLSFKSKDSINMNEALDLCQDYYVYTLYRNIEPISRQLLKEDDKKRYIIEDSILVKTPDGATLSAIVARKRNISAPQPVALFFTIYADPDQNLFEAKQSVCHGYAGVVALTRGKGLSPDPIEPYEHEADDVNAIIDWISKQLWCNGKVGMYGGSYSGYAQWAATKKMNPALKTIVPYVAAIPGFGLPMENNVFLNANYGWAFFVTDNKYLDYKTYNDPQRWNSLQERWYKSGVAYRKLDSIDGAHNKWLQRWLQHPSYDKYWQRMVPYKEEYARINIPVLTITGYYDDGQISAMQYLREHYKYNRNANHYLIIGPYDHFGAQKGGIPVLRDYKVDPAALINTREITYQWLDYILKDGLKPELLKNKINYEVMGANTWRHAASLEKMNDKMLTLYLDNSKSGNYFNLSEKKPEEPGFTSQQVNFADRSSSNNSEYYPYPIIIKELTDSSGLYFISEPFDKPVSVVGMFSGELRLSINKKDVDFGVVLYEVMPDGQFFHLSYYLGRASYAKDMSQRVLLTPGQIETIPFERTRLVSRQLSKGSRLLIVVNVNKNPEAQINYGTGKDVSDETIQDAKAPLEIKWYNDSFIKIPVGK